MQIRYIKKSLNIGPQLAHLLLASKYLFESEIYAIKWKYSNYNSKTEIKKGNDLNESFLVEAYKNE